MLSIKIWYFYTCIKHNLLEITIATVEVHFAETDICFKVQTWA